jgi:AcrR family transcriptional regulator
MLASALELVDREGLSALSMRRLGAELGVEAMALYRYAASKDALLDGLVVALYPELESRLAATEPDAEPGPRGAPGATGSPGRPTTCVSPTQRQYRSSSHACRRSPWHGSRPLY